MVLTSRDVSPNSPSSPLARSARSSWGSRRRQSTDSQFVVSGGYDGTVRLWEASTGTRLRTLQAERRYECLDITGPTGVTAAQDATSNKLAERSVLRRSKAIPEAFH